MRRKITRESRYMIMHAIPINCLSTNPPTCSTRYEWRELENLDSDNIAVIRGFQQVRAHGVYVPIKF